MFITHRGWRSGRFNFIKMICLTDIKQINSWIKILKPKKIKYFCKQIVSPDGQSVPLAWMKLF